MVDAKELKANLTTDQIYEFLTSFGAEPIEYSDKIICKTICHGGEQHKLYYYFNSNLFHCYTECSESFDIFQLMIKIKKNEGLEWTLPQAVHYICQYFGIESEEPKAFDSVERLEDWDIFKKYEQNEVTSSYSKDTSLKEYDINILKNYPQPKISSWESEGITNEAMKIHNIKYDPVSHGIIIPHFDINNRLVGIRERTLIKQQEKYGKYLPAVLQGNMYNHPLSFNLYNIEIAAENIKSMKKAIVFESEKSCIKYTSLFGKNNNISVAVCGSNLITFQVKILLSLGVEEIIVAFDRQFQEIGDKEFKGWTKKLEDINKKYFSFVNMSFIFDKKGLLDYKDSPIDKTKDIFLELLKERVRL